MARQLRIEFPGAVYHVMSRGNARQNIFHDDHDRHTLLDTLWSVCERLDWSVWAYCLMPNHYHLLLQTAQANLSRGMREVNGHYSMAFNARHERVGHVFQGRFKSLLVDKDAYLLELSRYIVLNPVRSGLCAHAAAWPWSSYRAVVGLSPAPPRLSAMTTLAAFGSHTAQARTKFEEFVRAGQAAACPTGDWRVPTIAGDDDFIAGITSSVRRVSREVPRIERALKPLARYAEEMTDRRSAIRAAYASGTYTQAEIARHFGLHYTTVCRILDNSSCRDAKKQDVTP